VLATFLTVSNYFSASDFDAKPSTSGYALGSITPSTNISAEAAANFDFPEHHGKKRAATSLNNENDPGESLS
jgi:hypothetical protein